MKVNGFAHCALYTPHLEEAVKFYEEVFGAKNLGYFQASTRGCWLQLGDDILEIFFSEELGTGCFKHIAITCDDVDAFFAKAIAYGCESLVEPKDAALALTDPVNVRLAFVRGVSGEEIELFCVYEG